MGSRVDGCQTPQSSGSHPGIQVPEGHASRKHHGITRARTQAWSRAIFARKGAGRTAGSEGGKAPICPIRIHKPQFDHAGLGFASHDVSLPRRTVTTIQVFACGNFSLWLAIEQLAISSRQAPRVLRDDLDGGRSRVGISLDVEVAHGVSPDQNQPENPQQHNQATTKASRNDG